MQKSLSMTTQKHNQSAGQRGMTLLEILLYISISGAVLFAAASLLTTIYEVKQKGRTIQSVEEEGSLVSYTVQRYLQNADRVTVTEVGKPVDKITVGVITNNLESVVTLYAENGSLKAIIDNANPTTLTSGDIVISNLSFNVLSAASGIPGKGFVSYEFTASSTDKTGRNNYSKNFEGGVSIR